jgi:hypothetical protein
MKTTIVPDIDSTPGKRSHNKHRVRKSEFRHHLFIESYGVKIGITSNTAEGIDAAQKAISENLPNCFREINETDAQHHFLLVRNRSRKDSLYKNGEKSLSRTSRDRLIDYLGSEIRRTVAEFAVGRVFVHAGVVSWKGKTIMIPGESFSGKTTLTASLVKLGALYYSDEYAVLDEDGYVHPFPKTLSVRGEIDDYTQVEYAVEELGGTAATEKSLVSIVLITEYKPNGKWHPKVLGSGNGILEMIKHTVSIRQNPDLALRVLNKVASGSVILKSRRSDISVFTGQIIKFVEAGLIDP